MLTAALIVFREMLEMAIIISMVLSNTSMLSGRRNWVLLGIVLGIVGAFALALGMERIANLVEGTGQELWTGAILLLGALLIGWTVLWMAAHRGGMTQKLKNLADMEQTSKAPFYALLLIVTMAILREGAEIVLFSFGLLASHAVSTVDFIIGATLGTVAGIAVGMGIYYGLIALKMRGLFQLTSVLLILLASSMAGQGANFLAAADLLPELSPALWDSAWLISNHSMVGRFLSTFIGYSDRPTGIQAVFYLITCLGLLGSYLRIQYARNALKPKK